MSQRWTQWFGCFDSMAGYLVGTIFFAASLTPSLIPRTPLTQGLVSGVSMAAGYGLGVAILRLWSYLELPVPGERTRGGVMPGIVFACIVIAILFLWQSSEWQKDVMLLMKLEPPESSRPFKVGLIALVLFSALILLGRLFRRIAVSVARPLKSFLPRRVSYVVGFTAAAILFWLLINGLIFRVALRLADVSYQQIDAMKEEGFEEPTKVHQTGSPASLISWNTLGRAGRQFVSTGPSRAEIAQFLGADALEPIRVYVGLNSAERARDRALLALEELKRLGAFERSVLVIVTPTGTGWVDPAAMDTLEYLHGGDIAVVALQYSYLPSWLTLLVEPTYGATSARELFMAVYDHWTKLPAAGRPRLYLFGLSLGALNSDLSVDLFDVVGDPFQGALWAGPPFNSETWRLVTQNRVPGSPAWLPRFRDSSIIRFTNQEMVLDVPGARWGPMRIVYLQYASDPITFFDPRILYRRPEWLEEPRGPDVSKTFRWFPMVTMLQLAVDMMAGTTAPAGYGHLFAPEHYIHAWVHVTDVKWKPEDVARLKAHFARQ